FVNNGDLAGAASPAGSSAPAGGGVSDGTAQAVTAGIVEQGTPATAGAGGAVVPGTGTAVLATGGKGTTRVAGSGGREPSTGSATTAGTASSSPTSAAPSYTRNNPPASAAHVPHTSRQQAFISAIAPGALAAQSRYGIPASVTIAQAIDESGWGQSALAIRDHNLFGIKGTGPAGTDMLPTQEYQNGHYVTVTAPFRVYHNVAESIADHGHLLATGSSYQHAMADRHLPDAFATNLTGVY